MSHQSVQGILIQYKAKQFLTVQCGTINTETIALVASTINEYNVTMELRGLRFVQLIRPISGGVTFTRKHVHELAAKDMHCVILKRG
jgi:hypothetical protein